LKIKSGQTKKRREEKINWRWNWQAEDKETKTSCGWAVSRGISRQGSIKSWKNWKFDTYLQNRTVFAEVLKKRRTH
jgi:hypothetical protein